MDRGLGKLEGSELDVVELELEVVMRELRDMVMCLDMGVAAVSVSLLVVTTATVGTVVMGAEIEGQDQITLLLGSIIPGNNESFKSNSLKLTLLLRRRCMSIVSPCCKFLSRKLKKLWSVGFQSLYF